MKIFNICDFSFLYNNNPMTNKCIYLKSILMHLGVHIRCVIILCMIDCILGRNVITSFHVLGFMSNRVGVCLVFQ